MSVLVTTPSGSLAGTDLGHSLEFRGIPFAAPPTGERRYRPPEPVEPWMGVRTATAFGPVARQNDAMSVVVRRFLGGAAVQSEDCLYLNVWTPAADGRRRPVLVWIHGGAFTLGSGGNELYVGSRLSRRGDVVVVTINYRLGALGFLNADGSFGTDSGITPNCGLHDQLAALRWVQSHIESFGGDPEKVTVFGESAGGMSVGTLLGLPAAQGLFRNAILQSGAAHNVSTPAKAAEVARLFLDELRADGESPAALRAAPAASLLKAQRAIADRLGVLLGILPWQPSVDGTLVAESPYDAIASGRVTPVPAIIGTNRDEWRLFLMGDPRVRTLDEAAFERRVRRTLLAVQGREDEDLVSAAVGQYDASFGTALERWCAFQSDRVFHAPAAMLASACSAGGADTYSYRFDWSPRVVGGYTGAFHALEIPFVFGTLRSGFLRAVLGVTTDARSLSNRMQQAWLSFARSGVPEAANLPRWERYTDEDRSTLVFDSNSELQRDVHESAVDFFGELLT